MLFDCYTGINLCFDHGLPSKTTIGSRVLGGQGSEIYELVLNQMGRRSYLWEVCLVRL